MFSASQLSEVSKRFPAHVVEIREFLLKEKLPVPSPEAIPELSSRVGTDARFRADLASLMRAVLYREREQVGYEDLLGILVSAAAGKKQDLTSETQEADIRELLRFLLQSRRPTRPEPEPEVEEERPAAEPEPAAAVPVVASPVAAVAVPVEPEREPVHAGAPRWAAESVGRERRLVESSVAVAEEESRPTRGRVPPIRSASWGEPVLPIRTTGLFGTEPEPELFAAQADLEEPWWRVHSSWLVGALGIALGLGVGLMVHHGVPAALTHVAVSAPSAASNDAKAREAAGAVAPKDATNPRSKAMVARKHSPGIAQRPERAADGGVVGMGQARPPAETGLPAPAAQGDRAVVKPAAGSDAAGEARPVTPEQGGTNAANSASVHLPGGVAAPVTVVKQVVTASENDEVEQEPTPTKAATHSIVQPGSAGIMAANVIYSPPPDYPAEASAAGVQGAVTVRAVVDPEGHVIYAHVVSGPALLRDAALAAVEKWRYRPLLYYGKPIAVTTTAILDFKFAK